PESGAEPSAGAVGAHSGGALFTSNAATLEFAGDASMLAAAALAFSGDGLAPTFFAVRANAASITMRRSTSMRRGCPEEYSARYMTFHEWQIMRSRATGSSAEN